MNEFNRIRYKLVKQFSTWFFKVQTDSEYAAWKAESCAVLPDIVGDEMINEFVQKYKMTFKMENGCNPVRIFYCPNYSDTDAAIVIQSHHTKFDGIADT